MEEVIDDFVTQGFKVIDQGARTVRMERRTMGDTGIHLLIALFTVWCLFGLVNLGYALFAYYCVVDELFIKVDKKKSKYRNNEDDEDDEEDD